MSDSASVQRTGSAALQALTAAALLLPGLSLPVRAQVGAQDSALDGLHTTAQTAFQAAQVRERRRALDGVPGSTPALGAETLVLKSTLILPSGDGLVIGYTQDTWSGATPVATAPRGAQGNRSVRAGAAGALVTVGASPMINGSVLLDAQRRPVTREPGSGRIVADTAAVDTLSSASPETRQQLDARLTRRLRDGTLDVGGSVSSEHDFHSVALSLGRRVDFDRQLGTLSLGLGLTRSDIAAVLDHDAAPYITRTAYATRLRAAGGRQVFDGRRQEWSASVGLSRVLSASAVLEGRLGHVRSSGDLSNPYKLASVIFAPPAAAGDPPGGVVNGDLRALMEQRPSTRRQWSMDGKLVMHHEASDGALHLGFGVSRDDWGISSHRLELEWFQPLDGGWMLSPRLRWYRQGAARFYAPWLVSPQAYRQVRIGDDGQPVITAFDPALLPAHFSSDRRLSAFGRVGLGLGLSKALGRGASLDLGLDIGRQSAALARGGRAGDDASADLRYAVFNATLQFELGGDGNPLAPPAGHGDHAHAGLHLPAGVQAGHVLGGGERMVGYRHELRRLGGPMRRGARPVGDAELATSACAPAACLGRPEAMQMRMQMLDLMLGLSDDVSLMLMPQFMTMQMDTRLIDGATVVDEPVHFGRHQSGGLGDTQAWGLVKLHDSGDRRWVLGLGLSVPTGSSALVHRRSHQQDGRAMDYGMQLGSGTWDLLTRLTYSAGSGPWSWGGQLGATLRLQQHNPEGYALGDQQQASAWLARRLSPHWVASLRGGWLREGAVQGAHRQAGVATSPPDGASNHGGRFSEFGLGVQLDGLPGALRGTTLGLEWLLPGRSTVRGYQLERRGGLVLGWSQHW